MLSRLSHLSCAQTLSWPLREKALCVCARRPYWPHATAQRFSKIGFFVIVIAPRRDAKASRPGGVFPQNKTNTSFDQARDWARLTKHHAQPDTICAVTQLLTTVVPLAGLWTLMMMFVRDAYWLTLALSVPAAAFTVRLFAIQHDCGHRSFLKSRRLNDMLGALAGVVTLTPHGYWRQAHNIHHATCGDLEKRGIGDVSVLTVSEYKGLSLWGRIAYRVYRNPLALMTFGPIYLFVVKYRLPLDLIGRTPKLLFGVMGTNLAIAAVMAGLGYWFGFWNVIMVQVPIVLLSSAAGVWLFYVQHQFEQTYWRTTENWDFHEASVMASSFYDLPAPLAWFSGHIGLHHIHHLSSRIPNYKLRECLDDVPAMRAVNQMTLRTSLGCFRLALWDEGAQRLISFAGLKRRPTVA